MHKKRIAATTKLPIPRKGTKYIARALSDDENAVPVLIAVRDMLKMAKTAKEVKGMVNSKLLKINGRNVKDYRESIKLFNLFEAGKAYKLSILPTKRFVLEETSASERLCKVIGKKTLKAGQMQINFHDGSNVISKEKVKVGDSVYLDIAGKIKKHVSFEKGKKVFITAGKYIGLFGAISELKDKKAVIVFKDKEASAELPVGEIIVQ